MIGPVYNEGAFICSTMRKRSELFFSVILVPLDFLALLAAFVVAYIIRVKLEGRPVAYPIAALVFLKFVLILLPIWILIFALSGLYTQSNLRGRLDEIGKVFIAVSGGVMFTILLDFLQRRSLFPSKSVPVYAYGLGLVFVWLSRTVVRAVQRALFNFGIGVHNALIIGSGEIAQVIAEDLSHQRSGYRVLGCVDTAKGAAKRMSGLPIYDSFGEAQKVIGKNRIDEIIQADSALDQNEVLELVHYATNNHLAYRFVPNQFGLYASNAVLGSLAGIPMIEIRLTPLDGWGRIAKRAFDVLGALLGIIVLSPVLLIVALLVKLQEPRGPVIYRHRRLSRTGRELYVLKFRTMSWKYSTGEDRPHKTAEDAFRAMGREDLIEEFKKVQKVENDPRVSSLGNFLRKSSLDELPQLFNVLRGDMSMVGPRPILPVELKHYGERSASFLALKPGVTGLWQISGRNDISYEDRVKLDIYYVENWTLWLDLKILVKTVLTILNGRGAY
jgi:exopolysaccharide biosynthesis polyprenyl glycosylphosphotransferase